MVEMNHQTLGLNVINELVGNSDFESCTRIPVKEGTGEILVYIDSNGGGELIVEGGNTVFGGKQRSFDIPDISKYLLRLEVGPHLIKDETGCYLEISTNSGGIATAIELN